MRITADIRRVEVTGRRPMIEGLFNETKKYRMVLWCYHDLKSRLDIIWILSTFV